MNGRCGSFPFFDHFTRLGYENVAGFVAEEGDAVGGAFVAALIFGETKKVVCTVEGPKHFFKTV